MEFERLSFKFWTWRIKKSDIALLSVQKNKEPSTEQKNNKIIQYPEGTPQFYKWELWMTQELITTATRKGV